MRFLTSSIGVLSTLTIFAASSCGSTSSGPSAQQACADLAAARCKQRSTCTAVTGSTGVGASLARVYGDMATCLQREETVVQERPRGAADREQPDQGRSVRESVHHLFLPGFLRQQPAHRLHGHRGAREWNDLHVRRPVPERLLPGRQDQRVRRLRRHAGRRRRLHRLRVRSQPALCQRGQHLRVGGVAERRVRFDAPLR